MNRFQFVEDHKDAYGVKRLCEVVEVARSSFYAWLDSAGRRAAKATDDAVLAARIRVLQDPAQGGDRAYGAPRITADLNDGVPVAERVNHKRVARVMREHRLAGIRLRRRVKTTIPDQSARRFPDLIGRDFSVGDPGRRYVGDITYLPIADGTNLYLASCIDLGSRKLAGWQVADHMRTELVEDALRAAHHDRGSLVGGLIVGEGDEVISIKQSGQVARSAVADVPVKGRDTMGVIFAKPDKRDRIVAVTLNNEQEMEAKADAEAEAGPDVPLDADIDPTDPVAAPEDVLTQDAGEGADGGEQ